MVLAESSRGKAVSYTHLDMSEYNKVIQIEPQHDQFDDVRMEYAQMLKQQLAKGNNGLVRTKYITFSIEAKSVKEAKPRLCLLYTSQYVHNYNGSL